MNQVINDRTNDESFKDEKEDLKIRLSYDILSPWSYLALVVLKRYRSIWKFDLILNPVWLGGVIAASKNTPPFRTPNKFKLMNEELPLMAKFFGVEYQPFKSFPVNSLSVMRLLRVIRLDRPDKLEICTERLYNATFVDQISPQDFESMVKSLSSSSTRTKTSSNEEDSKMIFDEDELKRLIDKSQSEENKIGLKDDADRLVNQEFCFGFPWIQVSHQKFKVDGSKDRVDRISIFGSDRFEFLAHWLGKDWYGPNPKINDPKSKL